VPKVVKCLLSVWALCACAPDVWSLRRYLVCLPDIKNHPFFAGLDWDKLMSLDVEPPFKPKVESETDLNNFDSVCLHADVPLIRLQSCDCMISCGL
jgi:hypothetical protein